jgi:hypothetical protein
MRGRILGAGAAAALAASLAAPGVAGAATDTGSLSITAHGSPGTTVTGSGQFTVAGDSPVDISVSHLSGGTASLVAGPNSDLPTAVEFPPYVASGTYPRAVVEVVPSSGTALSPGRADFEFGAVFRLDAQSQGRTDDNGNNAFQRGLSGQPAMFKLELDGGRPSCTVKGTAGKAIVRSGTTVTHDAWYEATCSRVAGKLTVAVTALGSSGSFASATAQRSTYTSTGTVGFASTVPASIGGKLYNSGAIDSGASDQFNGAIAEVWIHRL